MPYIDQTRRERICTDKFSIGTVGELNFAITRLCNFMLGASPHYEDFNAIIGVLECVKLEMYRRRVAPYEDKKMLENGDVYPSA